MDLGYSASWVGSRMDLDVIMVAWGEVVEEGIDSYTDLVVVDMDMASWGLEAGVGYSDMMVLGLLMKEESYRRRE